MHFRPTFSIFLGLSGCNPIKRSVLIIPSSEIQTPIIIVHRDCFLPHTNRNLQRVYKREIQYICMRLDKKIKQLNHIITN